MVNNPGPRSLMELHGQVEIWTHISLSSFNTRTTGPQWILNLEQTLWEQLFQPQLNVNLKYLLYDFRIRCMKWNASIDVPWLEECLSLDHVAWSVSILAIPPHLHSTLALFEHLTSPQAPLPALCLHTLCVCTDDWQILGVATNGIRHGMLLPGFWGGLFGDDVTKS